MNELCKLKGHMWFCCERKLEKVEDGYLSVCIKKRCARCGEEKEVI